MTKKKPTEAELRILRVLWKTGPQRLSVLSESLQDEGHLARTTVATMLKIMREKGLVERVEKGGRPIWQARVRQETASSRSVWEVIDHFFDGSAHQMVAHLLSDKKLSASDRSKIEELIQPQGIDPKQQDR